MFESTYRPQLAEFDAESAPRVRWTGSVESPGQMVIMGSSPTARDLTSDAAQAMGLRLHMTPISVWTNTTPIDRFLDRLKMLFAVSSPDVVVLEVSFTFTNDYLLGFRQQLGSFVHGWNRNQFIYDPELNELERALGFPAVAVGNASRFRVALEQIEKQVHRNEWFEMDGDRDSYESRPITEVTDTRMLSNHIMVYSMGRIAELCRAHGVGLVAWVPPRLEPLVVFTTGPGGERIDPAEPSRRALQLAARRWKFKVFDYNDLFDDQDTFLDALHLNAQGAEVFSQRFFSDLEAFLTRDSKNFNYHQVGATGKRKTQQPAEDHRKRADRRRPK